MWIEFEGDWMTAVWETAQGARRTAIDMQNTRASTQALGWWGSNGQQEIKWSWKITIFNGKILEKSTINGHLGDFGGHTFCRNPGAICVAPKFRRATIPTRHTDDSHTLRNAQSCYLSDDQVKRCHDLLAQSDWPSFVASVDVHLNSSGGSTEFCQSSLLFPCLHGCSVLLAQSTNKSSWSC